MAVVPANAQGVSARRCQKGSASLSSSVGITGRPAQYRSCICIALHCTASRYGLAFQMFQDGADVGTAFHETKFGEPASDTMMIYFFTVYKKANSPTIGKRMAKVYSDARLVMSCTGSMVQLGYCCIFLNVVRHKHVCTCSTSQTSYTVQSSPVLYAHRLIGRMCRCTWQMYRAPLPEPPSTDGRTGILATQSINGRTQA